MVEQLPMSNLPCELCGSRLILRNEVETLTIKLQNGRSKV